MVLSQISRYFENLYNIIEDRLLHLKDMLDKMHWSDFFFCYIFFKKTFKIHCQLTWNGVVHADRVCDLYLIVIVVEMLTATIPLAFVVWFLWQLISYCSECSKFHSPYRWNSKKEEQGVPDYCSYSGILTLHYCMVRSFSHLSICTYDYKLIFQMFLSFQVVCALSKNRIIETWVS